MNTLVNFESALLGLDGQFSVGGNITGKRDGFRKVHFFSDPLSQVEEMEYKYANRVGRPSVYGYISLTDCKRPVIILQPTFRSSNWIFMEQFSLMLNGTVVLDRKFHTREVDRENDHESVTETVHFSLDDQELLALREVESSKQILIRLTGQKGAVGLNPEVVKTFTQGITKLLRIYDALDQAILKVGPVKDDACPV